MRGIETATSHTHEPCTTMLFRTSKDDQLLRRVRGEYRELPGMRLTIDQAAKLWDLDRQTCLALLDTLVASRFLALDDTGRYQKARAAPWGLRGHAEQ